MSFAASTHHTHTLHFIQRTAPRRRYSRMFQRGAPMEGEAAAAAPLERRSGECAPGERSRGRLESMSQQGAVSSAACLGDSDYLVLDHAGALRLVYPHYHDVTHPTAERSYVFLATKEGATIAVPVTTSTSLSCVRNRRDFWQIGRQKVVIIARARSTMIIPRADSTRNIKWIRADPRSSIRDPRLNGTRVAPRSRRRRSAGQQADGPTDR